MKGCVTFLGCFASIVTIVFVVVFSIQFCLMLIRGEPVTSRSTGLIVDEALLGGFLLATALCICGASDAWERRKARNRIRRNLLARDAQSDADFCRAVPQIDQQFALRLRQRLAMTLVVPSDNLYATDKLGADLDCAYPFEDLYEEALGGHSICDVASDEILAIIDKPDRTIAQCAEEIRLLAEWNESEGDGCANTPSDSA